MYLNTYYKKLGNDRMSGIRHTNADQIEIIQTMVNDGSITVGDHTLPMRYGAVYALASNLPHCTSPEIPSGYTRSIIIIDRKTFDTLIEATATKEILKNLYDMGISAFYPKPAAMAELESLFFRMDRLSKAEAAQSDILLCLLQLIIKLRDCSDISHEKKTKLDTVMRAKEYIERRITQAVTTAETAKALHINKSHLCRVFKEATGMTVTEYITEKRLKRADELLSDTSLSLLDISAQSGFSSESYFISRYREKYGISPGKKRRMSKDKNI